MCLPQLAEISIPKKSQEVVSAVGFPRPQLTCTSGENPTELAFVWGKTRVAPMKVMTVPKLELQAALLAARFKREICRALTVTVDEIFMWTHCTIVLQWINSTNKHPIFIGNRVSEIPENTSVDKETTMLLVTIRKMLARVVCPLKFCDSVAAWGVQTSWESSNSPYQILK